MQLPQPLIESLEGVTGFDEEAFVRVHQSGEQVTSIRLNPAKVVSIEQEERLLQQLLAPENTELPISKVPWCAKGRYLPQRPFFTFDPSFHAGAYYVQEASSMFIDHILQQIFPVAPPQKILDMCAAPGGKSTLLAARCTNSFIISNEVIKSRVTILAENISKWGSDNVLVTHNDPKDFQQLPGYFDLVVVDAPCSGSGLFRKDPGAIKEWSEANVNLCSYRQQRILGDGIGSLKNNGYLIYSTCSYSKQEDEDICDWIIDELQLEPVHINIPGDWGIVETFSEKHNVPGYRFYPGKIRGEGFFVACFRQAKEVNEYYNMHSALSGVSKGESVLWAPLLRDNDSYAIFKQKETFIAYRKMFEEDVATIQNTLNVRKSGVALGTIKGKDVIPHHELSLSTFINENVPAIQLDLENAIRYLKRQDLSVEIAGKGWMLAKYDHLNLGWMKVLPNRINNYYPTDWRILKH